MLTRGCVLWAKWIARQEKSQTRLAVELRMPQSVISNYLRGDYPPSRERANQIEDDTEGEVPARSWDQVATAEELREYAAANKQIRAFSFREGWRTRRAAQRATRKRKAAPRAARRGGRRAA